MRNFFVVVLITCCLTGCGGSPIAGTWSGTASTVLATCNGVAQPTQSAPITVEISDAPLVWHAKGCDLPLAESDAGWRNTTAAGCAGNVTIDHVAMQLVGESLQLDYEGTSTDATGGKCVADVSALLAR